VRACESEDLPAVPGAPRPAAIASWNGRLAVPVAVGVPAVRTATDRLCVRRR